MEYYKKYNLIMNIWLIILFVFILFIVYSHFNQKSFTVYCVDDKGLTVHYTTNEFNSITEVKANAVKDCKDIMFNPIDYYVVEVE